MSYENFDYIGFFDNYGITYSLGGKNLGQNDIGIRCLFCDDSSFHLAIHRDKGVWHCWRCGEKGTLWRLVKEIGKTDDNSLIKDIFDRYGDGYFSNKAGVTKSSSSCRTDLGQYLDGLVKIEELMKRENRGFFWQLFKQWTCKRKIPLTTFVKYECYLPTSVNSYFAYRLVIPIFDQDGCIACWVGRDMTGRSRTRYLPTPASISPVSYQSCLYIPSLNISCGDKLLLVEGIFDAWRVEGIVGYKTVATLGKVVSRKQLNKLIKLITFSKVKEVVIMFDGDGLREANSLQDLLGLFCDKVKVCSLPYGKDPDSFCREDIQEFILATK